MKPGVAIGDIGKKMGRDGIDNGWIQFTNVRIPRQFMLMRFSKVDRDGKVTEPPLAQLAYGALIGGRVSMASDSFYTSSRFLTIAIRYAAIRRQFSSTPGQKETVILDYPFTSVVCFHDWHTLMPSTLLLATFTLFMKRLLNRLRMLMFQTRRL